MEYTREFHVTVYRDTNKTTTTDRYDTPLEAIRALVGMLSDDEHVEAAGLFGDWAGSATDETPEQIACRMRDEFVYTSDYGFKSAVVDALRSYGAAQRERDAQIAHDRATEWDAVKGAHPDDAATLAIANARYLEACDIAALIRA